ncbi:MAG: family 43 glycosylhydrolase [Chitinispirillaceae bacterium]|nr:family 43 glycosylhydrolase [Chitinispirillaceae bacterium]
MKISFQAMSPFFLIVLFLTTLCFPDNPIIQTKYTADPAPLVYNDTVFLYTTHDEDTAIEFVMYDWLLYTSTDMVNWRDHGVVASLKDFSWAGTIHAWAPQCVYRNGTFYLYCPVFMKGIGVLVADSPYGPFTDPLGEPLFHHNTNDIDPTVFIDDDGQAYMYWGNPECYYVKLNDDMISFSGSIDSIAPKLQTYQEGPWLYKRDNRYYLAFASSCCPQGIGYAMSESPVGPWTVKGYIMNPSSNASHNHPGIIDYKGSSYVFGFDYELQFSHGIPRNNELWRRSVCLSVMTYNADGTIKNVPWWGRGTPLPSVPQVGYLNPFDTTQAETICWSSGVRTEECNDSSGGLYVDSIHNGDYIKVEGVDFGSDGAKLFEARVASASGGGNIELHLDTATGPLAGTCAVEGTGGWQTWVTRSCDVSGAIGVHDLFFRFTGDSGMLFNFNWWKFTSAAGIGNAPTIKSGAGKEIGVSARAETNMVLLDFQQAVSPGTVTVHLFDLSGKLIATLFEGRLQSLHQRCMLDRTKIRSGSYLLQVTVNRKTVFSGRTIVN